MKSKITPLIKAITYFGGQKKLAAALGIKQPAISLWIKSRVPAQRVLDIERKTKGTVTRYELRPDLYPRE